MRHARLGLRVQGHHLGQGGFTLPFVLVMVALSLVAISSVMFLATHFRSITSAEDGERVYYALDATVEAVMADLVRGADALDLSYQVIKPEVSLYDQTLSAAVDIFPPGAVAGPAPIQQYFDPGLRNPELLNVQAGRSYLVHIFNVHPGVFQVNWAFDVSATGGQLAGKVILKVFEFSVLPPPGGANGCPTGFKHALVERNIESAGTFSVNSGAFDVTESVISVAFCVETLTDATLTTNPYAPTGLLNDTWIYAIAFKDYKITAEAEGASITVHVRQMPGPTEPPGDAWSDTNISWITNRVTPYQWAR